jgi:hypothetical protein
MSFLMKNTDTALVPWDFQKLARRDIRAYSFAQASVPGVSKIKSRIMRTATSTFFKAVPSNGLKTYLSASWYS